MWQAFLHWISCRNKVLSNAPECEFPAFCNCWKMCFLVLLDGFDIIVSWKAFLFLQAVLSWIAFVLFVSSLPILVQVTRRHGSALCNLRMFPFAWQAKIHPIRVSHPLSLAWHACVEGWFRDPHRFRSSSGIALPASISEAHRSTGGAWYYCAAGHPFHRSHTCSSVCLWYLGIFLSSCVDKWCIVFEWPR